MSDSILNQLIELFPDVSEEFIYGIYDAHKDEEATIEELVDVILSFEFRPLRENTDEHSLGASNVGSNGPFDIKLEVPSVHTNSCVNQSLKENVLQKSTPNYVGDMPSKGMASLLEKSSDDKPSGGLQCSFSKETSKEVFLDNNQTGNESCRNSSTIKVELKSDAELEIMENSSAEIQHNEINRPTNDDINKRVASTNSVKSSEAEEEGDDSSPEYAIRYIMREENVMERYNITTDVKEIVADSEENREFVLSNPEVTNNLTHLAKNASNKLSSSKRGIEQQKALRFRKSTTKSQNSSCQALPHCSTRRVRLRSCKVKNEEERLRRKLIHQSRRLHEMQGKNTSSMLCSSQFLDIDKKYTLLCTIFTDASPTYLLHQCELLSDQEQILAFISENLELKDYPKMETIKEEPRLMEDFHCTISEFLEVIPDPVAEFSSTRYVRVGYEENSEIYLKARYEGLSDEDVKVRLKANNYNLTNVCSQLEEEGRVPTPGVLSYIPLHHPANIFFHQEVWYIEHREEVHSYQDSALEAFRVEEELNRPPPPPDEVFECEICVEEIVEYVDLGTCDGPVGHLFCISCIKRSVELRIGEGETSFPCLTNCGAFIPLQTIEEIIPRNLFDKLMGRIQEEEIRKANIAGVETCPFCPYAYGPGEETLFICLNPNCMKSSCRICRKEDHSPDLCEMFKNEDEERARHIIENKMAEALMRTCHSCGKNFVKSGGCNKMECTCGAKMCYVCRQPVQDYNHFNGPGGDNTNRCELFSNDVELHDRPVEATAQQVFNEIAANNPQLNLDRAKLIPK